jgi:hypothetical protein
MGTATTTGTSTGTSRRWRRRNYLINPGFQWKYTLALGTAVFLAASMMGFALFGSLHEQARLRVLHPETVGMWHNARLLVVFGVAFAAVLTTALFGWGVVMTHRISGPIHVLEHHLGKLARGQFPKQRALRKRDEFKHVHEMFWKAVEALKAQKQTQLTALDEALKTAQSSMTGDPEGQEQALRTIADQIQGLRNEIADALGGPVDDAPATPPAADTARTAEPLAMAESNA